VITGLQDASTHQKQSCLDFDVIPNWSGEPADYVFSGKRKRRLYIFGEGVVLNADINAAANILRKEIGDGWLHEFFALGQLVVDKDVADLSVAIKHIGQQVFSLWVDHKVQRIKKTFCSIKQLADRCSKT
jgi:hypothetical protein